MIPTTPQAIQKKSFAIIDELLADHHFPPGEAQIVKRVVHATGDVDWADELLIHPQAVGAACQALRAGANIITDVQMVKAGINRRLLKQLGGELICWIRHKRVAQYAQARQITRAAASLRLLGKQRGNCLLVIGNAPSALLEICRLISQGKPAPAVIVGVPVGFVGAAESKLAVQALAIPYVTNRGHKGGSSVAVAIVNALLAMSLRAP